MGDEERIAEMAEHEIEHRATRHRLASALVMCSEALTGVTPNLIPGDLVIILAIATAEAIFKYSEPGTALSTCESATNLIRLLVSGVESRRPKGNA